MTEHTDQLDPDPADKFRTYLTAPRLAGLIVRELSEHHDVRSATRVQTPYKDRVAVSVVDHLGRGWRVHILTSPGGPPAPASVGDDS